MDKAAFLSKFSAVIEHSPWVAKAVFEKGVGEILDDVEALSTCFEIVFLSADTKLQLATLQAHPQLACALATPGDLTSDSAIEQAGAGLDQCSADELELFKQLNLAYLQKFGFPFIIAVKGRSRREILGHFQRRLLNDESQEFQMALTQVCRIARFRIGEILNA